MTDSTHLEAFGAGVSKPLSRRLVAAFIEGHRDPTVKATDLVIKLKDLMDCHLREGDNATDRPDRS